MYEWKKQVGVRAGRPAKTVRCRGVKAQDEGKVEGESVRFLDLVRKMSAARRSLGKRSKVS